MLKSGAAHKNDDDHHDPAAADASSRDRMVKQRAENRRRHDDENTHDRCAYAAAGEAKIDTKFFIPEHSFIFVLSKAVLLFQLRHLNDMLRKIRIYVGILLHFTCGWKRPRVQLRHGNHGPRRIAGNLQRTLILNPHGLGRSSPGRRRHRYLRLVLRGNLTGKSGARH